jgi:hypothetical protein
MKKSQTKNYLSPVPNNPRDNELYVDKQERGREKKFNKDNVIFGSTEKESRSRVATGKKLFEQFCKEAHRNTKKNIDDADMRNIYNSAQHLSYEDWVLFVNDEYSGRI